MNKRHLHHTWTKLRFIKPWYFLILTAISVLICGLALRANNEHMITLRDSVYAADKGASTTSADSSDSVENQSVPDVETALKKLQNYVTRHMNTNLGAGSNAVYPPIQLKYTYERLVKAQTDAAAQANSQIYTDAQHSCEQQDSTDFSGRNRVPCIEQYVQAHTTQQSPPIPDALYKFSFISPRWSPDLAGWSLVATMVSFLLFVVAFVANRWFRHAVA
ncbi:MAG: hypothetical protein WA843_03670 [Candidatus Saccharimonadales bacterium]